MFKELIFNYILIKLDTLKNLVVSEFGVERMVKTAKQSKDFNTFFKVVHDICRFNTIINGEFTQGSRTKFIFCS